MRNSPFSFALLILIILFYALCQCHPARAQTVSDLDLITTLDLTLTDKLYLTNVEATGSAKDKSVTLSQLVTLFGPTIEVSGSNITSGMVPNARLDSDLSAIAALTTTTYGRSLLAAADAAGLRTLAGLGSLATQSGTFSGTHSGTSSGTNTGDQDLSSYITSAAAATAYQPLDSDLTAVAALTTTSTGRSLLATADAAAIREIAGLASYGPSGFNLGFSLVGDNAGNLIATGAITAGTLAGDGSAITELNASNIASGTLAAARLATSGVTAASYTSANITVDQYGRITAASNGSSGLTIGSTAITGGTSGRLLTSGTSVGELTPGSGVTTWLATPTLANFNAATSDADAASLAGAAFAGATSVTTSAATTSAPGFSTAQSWSGSTAALTAVTNNVIDARTGAAIGGYLESWKVGGTVALAILRGDQYGNGVGGLWSNDNPIQFCYGGSSPYAMAGANYAGSGVGIQYSTPTTGFLSFSNSQNWAVQYGDLHIGRSGAGGVQLGKPLASGWVNQRIGSAGVIVGTTTNGSPTNTTTIHGSISTGTGTGGDVVIETYGSNGSSGTAIGTATERYRAKATGEHIFNFKPAPSSASDTGTNGEIRVDGDYIYFCKPANTWKRAALSTW